MAVGKRIYLKRMMISQKVIDDYSKIPAANVADCMNRLCAMHSEIRLMTPFTQKNMCGRALTVKGRAGDNLVLHKALNLCQPGDIIVVANEGDRSRALMGEIMISYCKYKELGGLVLDAPVRDIEAIREIGLPVYATGTTPGGPFKEGPGEINVPISIGGIQVCPGDIILGDADGVIVIPYHDAEVLLEAALKKCGEDIEKVQKTNNGTINRSWVEKNIVAKDFEIIDDFYPYYD